MTDNVYWILRLAINDGKLDEFKALAAEMTAATREEPGALNYEWFVDADGSTCHLYERYADNAAVMTHLGNFGAKFAERFMGLVTPTGFDVYGPADDTVRGALAGFNASHFSQIAGFAK